MPPTNNIVTSVSAVSTSSTENISDNNIGYAGAKVLAIALKNNINTKLTTLNISDNDIFSYYKFDSYNNNLFLTKIYNNFYFFFFNAFGC